MDYARTVLRHGHSDVREAEIIAEFDSVVPAGLGIESKVSASEVFGLVAENARYPGAFDA
jgi:hypothetical protein